MKRALLLGPGHWRLPWLRWTRPSPLEVRRRLSETLHSYGLEAVLLEEEPDEAGEAEDVSRKFHRFLDSEPLDAILVYWPRRAKMQTTWDELVILREEHLRHERGERGPLPPLHYLHDLRAMDLGEHLVIRERGARSAYLRGVSQLPASAHPWITEPQLWDAAAECAAQVTGLPRSPASTALSGRPRRFSRARE